MPLGKAILGLMVGIASVSLWAGFQQEVNAGVTKSVQETKVPAYDVLEVTGKPALTFSFAGHKGRVFALEGPTMSRDFVYAGNRIVFAQGAIFRHGSEYRPPQEGMEDEPWSELYRMPLEGNKVQLRKKIEDSDAGKDDIAVCGGYVLFQCVRDGMLALYDGQEVYQGVAPWKEEYHGMVGTPNGELLLVRQPDTICLAKLEGKVISEPQEILAHARKVLEEPAAVLSPVFLDDKELFVSLSLGEKFPRMLCSFDRKGELLTCYLGRNGKNTSWAVTEHYVLQAGRDEGLIIFDRATGKRLFAEKIKDFYPSYLYGLEGDKVLMSGGCAEYSLMELE